jgi:FAD dependent oxidoreductase
LVPVIYTPMIKKLILILLVSNCSILYAQTIKTDVLVVGGGASGVAAAIQCARSKVKTVLAAQSIELVDSPATEMVTLDANRNIPSGIWGEFRNRIKDFYKAKAGYDTSYNAALKFETSTGLSILKKIADTVKNLTLNLDASFSTIKKDGDRWEVTLTENGKAIIVKARVVVDATESGEVATKAGAKFKESKNSDGTNLYRTSIAAGEALPGQQNNTTEVNNYPPYPAWYIPVDAILPKDADNLLITEKAWPIENNMQYLPIQLEIGQGVGTIAAYCAFFKTTTKNLKVRTIQGELLDFKGYLLPFADVNQKDPNWRAIQQVCATGLLKGIQQNGQFVFMPDVPVTTDEIKPVLTEIYTRAFLWFGNEKPVEKFTVGNTLSLISDYTLTGPEILNKSIQKAWKIQYKFTLDFDLKRPITRREFAVLANKFLNPFARTVNLEGKLEN